MIVNKFGGNGGGGGYVLPTATDSRLGGVKIGSGINVAADGTISAEGGDYVVVEDLSAITNPTEGIVAFVKAKTVQEEHTTISIPSGYTGDMRRVTFGEGYGVWLDNGQPVGIDMNGWWRPAQDGEWHLSQASNTVPGPIYGKYDSETQVTTFAFIFETQSIDISPSEAAAEITVSADTLPVDYDSYTAIYNGTKWIRTSYVLENLTSAEVISLIDLLGDEEYADKISIYTKFNEALTLANASWKGGDGHGYVVFYGNDKRFRRYRLDGNSGYIELNADAQLGNEYVYSLEIFESGGTIEASGSIDWYQVYMAWEHKALLANIYNRDTNQKQAIVPVSVTKNNDNKDLYFDCKVSFTYQDASGVTWFNEFTKDEQSVTLTKRYQIQTKKTFKFNEMTQAELADMYAELTALPSATTNYNELYDFYNFADWNGGGHYRGWKMQGGYPDTQGKLSFSVTTVKENDMTQLYFFQTKISSDGTIQNRFAEYHLGS